MLLILMYLYAYINKCMHDFVNPLESNREVLTHGIKDFSSLRDRLLKNRLHYIENFMSVQ